MQIRCNVFLVLRPASENNLSSLSLCGTFAGIIVKLNLLRLILECKKRWRGEARRRGEEEGGERGT